MPPPPLYKEMKKIVRMAYLEGITIEEVRARQQHLAHRLSRRSAVGPPMQTNSNQEAEMATLRGQLKVLEE